ncbi:MAG: saccharopine dehydrogenase family protein [Saccharospirillaceae bacterium]|jgi:saccharopine dehydrogenase-like NADP-dependent oxidoreductase|nr:saccharopine dehydrogenase family protein [Saccharospirillaceae bacterium]
MKKNVLIIGAGAVGAVVAHKCAQSSDVFASVCLASKNIAKCDAIIAAVNRKNHHPHADFSLFSREVNAYNVNDLVDLIRDTDTHIVINVCTAFVNMNILDACLETGTAYIDTAVHEDYSVMNAPYPWYANYEWKKRELCKEKGVTAILGSGFDPGVVNAYCAYAQKHEFDSIESIDIMDVNDGDHGHFFSTNFDPEINLREIIEDASCLEDGQWRTYPHHSRSMEYNFPEVGEHKLYLMGHDEVHSLSLNIPDVKTVRFWMGFGEHYLNCLEVFEKVGLLNHETVTTSHGQEVVPLHVLKACLPDPASLAPRYNGKTCIGTLIKGTRDGKDKEVFVYNICDHEETYADIDSQAIAFTAGVPPVAAAKLIASGEWDVKTMANVEELDPIPFFERLAEMGLSTEVCNLDAGEDSAESRVLYA